MHAFHFQLSFIAISQLAHLMIFDADAFRGFLPRRYASSSYATTPFTPLIFSSSSVSRFLRHDESKRLMRHAAFSCGR